MLVCWRSFYPFLNKKGVSFPSAVLKQDFQDVHPMNFSAAFTGINLFVCLNMLTLLSCSLHVTWKSLNFSHYVTPFKLRSHRSSRAFLYVTNYLHSCIYLFLSDIFRIV